MFYTCTLLGYPENFHDKTNIFFDIYLSHKHYFKIVLLKQLIQPRTHLLQSCLSQHTLEP